MLEVRLFSFALELLVANRKGKSRAERFAVGVAEIAIIVKKKLNKNKFKKCLKEQHPIPGDTI